MLVIFWSTKSLLKLLSQTDAVYIKILQNSAWNSVWRLATCAEIVQPGQLPPTEVLIIEQLKLEKEGEDRVFIMQCTTLINTDLKNTNSAVFHKGQLTICTLFSSSWGMANVEEGTCVRGQAPACNHISHCT